MMTLDITIAETPAQFETAGRLFRAYGEYLGLDLEFQGFSQDVQAGEDVGVTDLVALIPDES